MRYTFSVNTEKIAAEMLNGKHFIGSKTLFGAREVAILSAFLMGVENKEIAKQVNLSHSLIAPRLTAIGECLGAMNRTHLIAVCYDRGYLVLNEA